MKLEFKCKKCNKRFVISGEDLNEIVMKMAAEDHLAEDDTGESVASAGLRNRHYQYKHQKPPKKPQKKEMPVQEL